MRKKGVEPIHPNREQEPESCASTNFATFARSLRQNNRTSALYAPYESMASFFLSHASFLTPYGILCHQRLCARLSPATDILPFKASPYLARWAQYGLQIALSRPMGSIRAPNRPISPDGLNTGSGFGYVLGLRSCAHTPPLIFYAERLLRLARRFRRSTARRTLTNDRLRRAHIVVRYSRFATRLSSVSPSRALRFFPMTQTSIDDFCH